MISVMGELNYVVDRERVEVSFPPSNQSPQILLKLQIFGFILQKNEESAATEFVFFLLRCFSVLKINNLR